MKNWLFEFLMEFDFVIELVSFSNTVQHIRNVAFPINKLLIQTILLKNEQTINETTNAVLELSEVIHYSQQHRINIRKFLFLEPFEGDFNRCLIMCIKDAGFVDVMDYDEMYRRLNKIHKELESLIRTSPSFDEIKLFLKGVI